MAEPNYTNEAEVASFIPEQLQANNMVINGCTNKDQRLTYIP